MWVLRFGNGVTSAGVAVDDALAQELRLADGAPAWAAVAGAVSVDRRAVRRRASRSASSPGCRGSRIARAAAAGPRMGDAAVGGGVHRSAVLDRHSVDAARDRAAGADAGANDRSRARRAADASAEARLRCACAQRRDARRSRSHRALHRRLLRGVPALRRVHRLLDVLLRGGQLQRDGSAVWRRRSARRAASCARPIARPSPRRLRDLSPACVCPAPTTPTRVARRGRADQHRRPVRPREDELVSGRSRGHRARRASWELDQPRARVVATRTVRDAVDVRARARDGTL